MRSIQETIMFIFNKMKSQYKSAYAKKRAAKKSTKPMRKGARKSAPKRSYKKRNTLVVPSQIKQTPGVLSKSLWSAAGKLSPSIRAMQNVGLRSIYSNNASIITYANPNHWSCYSIPHIQKSHLQNIVDELPPWETTVQTAPRRFVLETYLSEISLTNNTTASHELELYDVVCRKDLPQSNTFIIGAASAFICSPTPDSYITQGLAAAQGAASGTVAVNSLLIGSTPFDSPFFKDYFKVIKRTVVQQSPGACHRHTISLKPNKLIKEEDVNLAPGTPTPSGNMVCDSGLQCFTLIMLRPYAAVDTTVQVPPTSTIVTTPRQSLVTMTTYRYGYTEVVGQVSRLKYDTEIVGNPAPADVFTVVNPTSGLVGNVLTAP